MQHSAIHDPRAHSTPSQRKAAAQHLDRLKRLHGPPAVEVKPKQVVFVVAPPTQTLPPIPNAEIRKACEFASGSFRTMGEVERIQRAVIRRFPDVTLNDMKAARRTAVVVLPRQIAMYLVKELTGRSLPEIGRRFGGRDHTTILHAVRRIKMQKENDAALSALIEEIKASLDEVQDV